MTVEQWTLLATVVIGILASVAAIVQFRQSRQAPKVELSFGVISRNLMMGAAESVQSSVQMTFNGVRVARLSATTIALMNTGRLAIRAADFETAIKVALSDVITLFTATQISSSPSHLKLSILCFDDRIEIAPFLLNPGDYVVIRFIAESKGRVGATLETRVVGTSRHPVLAAGAHPGHGLLGILFFASMCALMVFALIFNFQRGEMTIFGWIFQPAFALVTGAGVVFNVLEVIKVTRMRFMGGNTAGLKIREELGQ